MSNSTSYQHLIPTSKLCFGSVYIIRIQDIGMLFRKLSKLKQIIWMSPDPCFYIPRQCFGSGSHKDMPRPPGSGFAWIDADPDPGGKKA